MTDQPSKYKCTCDPNDLPEIGFAVYELAKCQKAFNEQQEKYNKLLEFVKTLTDESYSTYENENEINWAAFQLLQEIGELK